MSDDVATLIAKRFIARRDVKARQYAAHGSQPGGYVPVTDGKDGPRLPWKMQDLHDHIEKRQTYGHYLLDQDSNCKLFAFDIDLKEAGAWCDMTTGEIHEFNPREAWLDRAHPSRPFLKFQMRMIAGKLARFVAQDLAVPVACAYTGAKGVHVYGLTGLISADDAREAALLTIESVGGYTPLRGNSFFTFENQDPIDGYPNFTVEVFPKQSSLESKDLGNLMRLPLGRNLKSTDPTFFLDLAAPMGELKPMDPLLALESGNPWLGEG